MTQKIACLLLCIAAEAVAQMPGQNQAEVRQRAEEQRRQVEAQSRAITAQVQARLAQMQLIQEGLQQAELAQLQQRSADGAFTGYSENVGSGSPNSADGRGRFVFPKGATPEANFPFPPGAQFANGPKGYPDKNNFKGFPKPFENGASNFIFGQGTYQGNLEPIRLTGRNVTKRLRVDNFRELEIGVSGDAVIRPGQGPISATGDSAVVDAVRTEMGPGNRMRITLAGFCVSPQNNCHIKLLIPSRNLESLIIDGAMNVALDEGVASRGSFAAHMNGAGNLHGSAYVDRLTAHMNGAGEIQLAGSVSRELQAQMNGAGRVDLSRMEAAGASGRAEVNGAGGVALPELGRLETTRNGAGSITYRGSPQITSHGQFEFMPGAKGRDPHVQWRP